MEPSKPEKVVFGIGEDAKGTKTVIIGVSDASWKYMRDGRTHTLDLTGLGLPIQIILFGGRTQEGIKALLAKAGDENTRDVTDQDFGIK
jgi:hypothetical protein